jgi:hypothetical protein
MQQLSDAISLLGRSDEQTDKERLAWLLLACERGIDCTSNAAWVRTACGFSSHCLSYSDQTDLVRELSEESWTDVQQRALELQKQIDQGGWDDLGLTSQLLRE